MWTNGSKCAVLLSFDFDAESMWTMQNLDTPCYLSRGQYGARVGIPRILSLLDRYGIRATFFVPADTARRHPDEVKEIHARGHEIGHHGDVHESPAKLDFNEERKRLEIGLETLQSVTGHRPIGYRSPSWDLSLNSIDLLKEYEFLYDSSLMGDDFGLYSLGDDRAGIGVVEIPVSWELDDAPHFLFNFSPYTVGLSAPSKVYEIWRTEFDGAYESGGAFSLAMHPQIIGRYHRLQMLEMLLQYVETHSGVWYTSYADAARDWLKQGSGCSTAR
jgi:peptidoglycan/xylan/chitin deacetylase (PgdA/CDA1 family)